MNKKLNIREFFLGANTYKGFHSFYEYVVPGIPKRLFILKGGPGTGKSTFLKRIATEFSDMGYDIEVHRCSSDNDSLDAVRIVDFDIAVMDGTSPHLTDPKYPAVSDEIVNLGEFWNTDNIKNHKDRIISLNKELKMLYASSYRFLNSAKEVQDDIEAFTLESFNMNKFKIFASDYSNKITASLEYKDREPYVRHLFHSSINSAGSVDYIEKTIPIDYDINYIKGENLTAATELLKKISDNFILKGYDLEIFHQPLNPDIWETFIVHDLKVAFTNDSLVEGKTDNIVELKIFHNKYKWEKNMELIEIDKQLMKTLIDEAINRIKKAKYLHDDLEKYYIVNMNFNEMQELRNKIIDKIKKMCK